MRQDRFLHLRVAVALVCFAVLCTLGISLLREQPAAAAFDATTPAAVRAQTTTPAPTGQNGTAPTGQDGTAPTSPTEATASPGPLTGPDAPDDPDTPSVVIELGSGDARGSGSGPIQIILLTTAIALGPALLMVSTAFTRLIIVLGLARNALNLQGVPPNQVLVGLALFLTLFVMAPTFSEANKEGLQPYLNNEISQSEAFDRATAPFKEYMLKQTREQDLAMFVDMRGEERPESPDDISLPTLIPAYVISELRAAFIIGFIIYIPFLIIDMVISTTLMSMGMVMLPPITLALPFKLMLFVLIDGWHLLVGTLVNSFAR
jgi:flagellar biosynthetic protein FliP